MYVRIIRIIYGVASEGIARPHILRKKWMEIKKRKKKKNRKQIL
jgi:hypothetical protein